MKNVIVITGASSGFGLLATRDGAKRSIVSPTDRPRKPRTTT